MKSLRGIFIFGLALGLLVCLSASGQTIRWSASGVGNKWEAVKGAPNGTTTQVSTSAYLYLFWFNHPTKKIEVTYPAAETRGRSSSFSNCRQERSIIGT